MLNKNKLFDVILFITLIGLIVIIAYSLNEVIDVNGEYQDICRENGYDITDNIIEDVSNKKYLKCVKEEVVNNKLVLNQSYIEINKDTRLLNDVITSSLVIPFLLWLVCFTIIIYIKKEVCGV